MCCRGWLIHFFGYILDYLEWLAWLNWLIVLRLSQKEENAKITTHHLDEYWRYYALAKLHPDRYGISPEDIVQIIQKLGPYVQQVDLTKSHSSRSFVVPFPGLCLPFCSKKHDIMGIFTDFLGFWSAETSLTASSSSAPSSMQSPGMSKAQNLGRLIDWLICR